MSARHPVAVTPALAQGTALNQARIAASGNSPRREQDGSQCRPLNGTVATTVMPMPVYGASCGQGWTSGCATSVTSHQAPPGGALAHQAYAAFNSQEGAPVARPHWRDSSSIDRSGQSPLPQQRPAQTVAVSVGVVGGGSMRAPVSSGGYQRQAGTTVVPVGVVPVGQPLAGNPLGSPVSTATCGPPPPGPTAAPTSSPCSGARPVNVQRLPLGSPQVRQEDVRIGGSHALPSRVSEDGAATARMSLPDTRTGDGLGTSRRQLSVGGCSITSLPPGASGAPTVGGQPLGSPATGGQHREIQIQYKTSNQTPKSGYRDPKLSGLSVVPVDVMVTSARSTDRQNVGDSTNLLTPRNLSRTLPCDAAENLKNAGTMRCDTPKVAPPPIRDAVLAEKDRELEEARVCLKELERQLQSEVAAHSLAKESIEATRREVRERDELLREVDLERANYSNLAESKSLLQAECETKDSKLSELQGQLKQATDLTNTYKVRHANLEKEFDLKTTEVGDLREHASQKDRALAELQDRLDVESAALVELGLHHQTMERELRASEEQRVRQERASATHDQELQQLRDSLVREREASATSSQVLASEAEHALLAQQRAEVEQMLRRSEVELAELERRRHQLDQQAARIVQLEAERQHKEAADAEVECEHASKDRSHRTNYDADKENRALRHTVQEQKSALYDLQSTLAREQTLATFIAPGEFLKVAKKQESETFTHENAAMKLRLMGLETEVQEVRWHSELLKRYLSSAAREAVAKELRAHPLPLLDS